MLVALLFVVFEASAQTDTTVLREVEVRDVAPVVRRGVTGDVTLLRGGVLRGMRPLGESDAVAVVKMLPGFSAGSDYASGVSVNGSALSQTSYTIDGTPVFAPFHFGGIFSTFISDHYPGYRISSRQSVSDMRVGGSIDALTDNYPPSRFGADLHFGTIASSGSIAIPIGEKTGVTVSARKSYMALSTGALLDTETSRTRYGLVDANITAVHLLDDENTLKLNAFVSRDDVRYTDVPMVQRTDMRWSNALANVSWRHRDAKLDMKHTVAYTRTVNRLALAMPQFDFSMPSVVRRALLYGTGASGGVDLGYALGYTWFQPQSAVMEASNATSPRPLRAFDGMVSGGSTLRLGGRSRIDYGLALSMMAIEGRMYGAIDPRAAFVTPAAGGEFSAEVSATTQYIQQVGFADIGLASNFMIPPVRALKPLRAAGVTLRYGNQSVADGLGVNAEIFCRNIRHEADYRGNLLDVLGAGYDALAYVTMSDGFNIGANFTANYSLGPVTGWCGYSLAICRRHFPESPDKWLPSATEPLHAFKAYADWQASRRLKLSAYFTFASGRPYTPVEAVFVIAGNVLTEYGDRNCARLPAYHKLDLSATYTFGAIRIGRHSVENYLNLSVVNAYGHRNVEMQYFTYDIDRHTISLHRTYSIYRFLPSLSYTLVI